MELLNIDLNEIASQAISEKVSSLESQVQQLQTTIQSQNKIISVLEKDANEYVSVLVVLDTLRDHYSSIKQGESDSGGWYDSKAKNQFKFISEILKVLYGIDKEYGGWYCYRSDGSLRSHLAVNYYNSKEKVCELLRVLYDDSANDINYIMAFKMPFDWEKEKIKEYALSPKYNTNSSIFGISQFWMEYGAGEKNTPHDLIMRSPYILEDDVFGIILTTIRNKRAEYKYLFALPEYNKNISKDKIQQLGRTLINIDRGLWDDTIKSFARKFLKDFCDKTLTHLKLLATNDNQFNVLHWKNFPAKYQAEFLKVMPFDSALKALNEGHCDLTPEEKASLIREILTVS
jgi:hypothetical protein